MPPFGDEDLHKALIEKFACPDIPEVVRFKDSLTVADPSAPKEDPSFEL